MAGPLTETNPMVEQAAGGLPSVQALMQNMLQQGQQKQDYLAQQQAAYNRDMERYAQMVEQSRQPENNEAAMWGGMAQAAAKVRPEVGNLGQMLGAVGGAYGDFNALQQQQNLKNQSNLTKLRQAEVRALESKDQNASMLRALTGGSKSGTNPTIKVVDGKLMKYDPITNTTEVLSGSQDQIKRSLYTTFFNAATKNEVPNPEEYAMQQTEAALRGFGGTTVKGQSNEIPGVRSSSIPEVIQDDATKPSLKFDVSGLSPEDRELVKRVIARYQANPNEGTKLQVAKALENLFGSGSIKPAQPESSPLTYIDKPKREMEKETAGVTGKALGEEFQSMQTAAESSGQLISQLDLLKKLDQNPNMPEGKYGEELQGVRSALKTLGIDVGDVTSAADLYSNLSGKMALLTRTSDGKNLMPGAMSDFEQKILRGLVPSLSGTAEGRMALSDLMQGMARSRMRFAEEASKMAAGNRGILPSEWSTRKVRIMKEEMLKMRDLNDEIAARFGGSK